MNNKIMIMLQRLYKNFIGFFTVKRLIKVFSIFIVGYLLRIILSFLGFDVLVDLFHIVAASYFLFMAYVSVYISYILDITGILDNISIPNFKDIIGPLKGKFISLINYIKSLIKKSMKIFKDIITSHRNNSKMVLAGPSRSNESSGIIKSNNPTVHLSTNEGPNNP
jgi:hypothetical protein